MDFPLVTICMPTYNQAKYVEESILSILNQDYKNIQLIISDDCSKDGTFEICEKLQNKYPEIIHLQRNDRNLGISGNVKTIYPLIKGKYVCWFSGDDIYAANKISTQIKVMEANNDCVFSFHKSFVLDEHGDILYEFNDALYGTTAFTENIAKNLLKHRCYICAISVMINRTLAGDVIHNEEANLCSDWLLLFELAASGKVIFIPETLCSYRRHANNISKTINIKYEENTFKYIQKKYPNFNAYVNMGLSNLYALYFFKYLFARKFMQAYVSLKKLIKLLIRSPKNIPKVIKKIYIELIRRRNLVRVTGTIIR